MLVLCTVFLGTQCENHHRRQLWSRLSILGENVFITSTYSCICCEIDGVPVRGLFGKQVEWEKPVFAINSATVN